MSFEDIFATAREWSKKPPARDADVRELATKARVRLPVEYLEFLRLSNGGEGELAIEPGWFALWPAEQVVPLNRQYNVDGLSPGYFAFGSNGGGEMLAFRIADGACIEVAMVPFVGDPTDATIVAASFSEFAQAIGTRCG